MAGETLGPSIDRPDENGHHFAHDGSPSVLPLSDNRELLSMEIVVPFFNNVVARTAALAWSRIEAKYKGISSLDEEQRKLFSVALDNEATHLMSDQFDEADWTINILDCEGKKEERKGGSAAKVDVAEGLHGKRVVIEASEGKLFADYEGPNGEIFVFDVSRRMYVDVREGVAKREVQIYIDPIEGTTAASSRNKGSVAIIAGSLDNGHSLVPPEDGDAIYTDRIIAGKKLKGKVSLDMEPEEIVGKAVEAYGLLNPQDLKIVVLDRPRNAKLIGKLEAAGATVIKIKAGDLMPALAALKEDEPIISMGSGGKTEAYIAAIAAKAVGGVFEGRYVDKDGGASKSHPQKLTLEALCPGDPANYFVSFASITGTPEYGLALPPVMRYVNGEVVHRVTVVDITQKGFFKALRPVQLVA